jgi:hypothetical protein
MPRTSIATFFFFALTSAAFLVATSRPVLASDLRMCYASCNAELRSSGCAGGLRMATPLCAHARNVNLNCELGCQRRYRTQ